MMGEAYGISKNRLWQKFLSGSLSLSLLCLAESSFSNFVRLSLYFIIYGATLLEFDVSLALLVSIIAYY